ncbi:hypothetical protein [Mycoplasma sp. ATU-Cv-508]|uniref:hypothetical protein n=1 Tax=Mycoplasma sp. ATU-Cv-508 TaxID=2048001 RepID=UPI000FDE2238
MATKTSEEFLQVINIDDKIANRRYYGLRGLGINAFIDHFMNNAKDIFILYLKSNLKELPNSWTLADFLLSFYLNELLSMERDILDREKDTFTDEYFQKILEGDYGTFLRRIKQDLKTNIKKNLNLMLRYLNSNLDLIEDQVKNKNIKSLSHVDLLNLVTENWNFIDNKNYPSISRLFSKNVFWYCKNTFLTKDATLKKAFTQEMENLLSQNQYMLNKLELLSCYIENLDAYYLETKSEFIKQILNKFYEWVVAPNFILFSYESYKKLLKVVKQNIKKFGDNFSVQNLIKEQSNKINSLIKEESKKGIHLETLQYIVPNIHCEEFLKLVSDAMDGFGPILTFLETDQFKSITDEKLISNKLADIFESDSTSKYKHSFIFPVETGLIIKKQILQMLLRERKKQYLERVKKLLNLCLNFMEVKKEKIKFDIYAVTDMFEGFLNTKKYTKIENLKQSMFTCVAIEKLVKNLFMYFHKDNDKMQKDYKSLGALLTQEQVNAKHNKTGIKYPLSENTKSFLHYYMCSSFIDNGLEVRNKLLHGEWFEKDLTSYDTKFSLFTIYMTVIEEIALNILIQIKKQVFKELEDFGYFKKLKQLIKKNDGHIVVERINNHLRDFITKEKLTLLKKINLSWKISDSTDSPNKLTLSLQINDCFHVCHLYSGQK